MTDSVSTKVGVGVPDADLRFSDRGEVSVTASRSWWDGAAADYQHEHGAFLDGFVWGPEGLREDDAECLGPVSALVGRPVLEIGAGAAQCSRWLRERGVPALALDVSFGQLQASRALNQPGAAPVPVLQADARFLPCRNAAFDAAFSSYGALPFVADVERVLHEVARVLRPGGRWVFSVTHPTRWSFRDEPGPDGLVATASYFDRTPYVERDSSGRVTYVEHHRTLGDWVRLCRAAGFEILDLIEPEWPAEHNGVWGGWSPLRGRLIPGTAIFVTQR